jgi:phage repressor protein C with HTH and peptisase S24 domain
MELFERIRSAREARGITQKAIADHFGIKPVSVTQWESGKSKPETEKYPDLARLLSVRLEWLMGEGGERDLMPGDTAPPPKPETRPAEAPLPELQSMPADVPVMGNARGGTNADFFLNGEIVDYVRRPPGIARQTGVFALYVVGTSMYPKYDEGALIYVSTTKPAKIDDYVVVEMHGGNHGTTTAGFVKRLEKRTATKIFCRQFNPDKVLEFDLKKVKAVHRIIPLEELLGV